MLNSNTTEADLSRLFAYFKNLSRVALSFSGGVDSALLVAAGAQSIGSDNVHAFTVSSVLHAAGDADEAEGFCRALGVPFHRISADPLAVPAIRDNGTLRCYHCKRYMLERIREEAEAIGIPHVLEGTNAEEVRGYRPGVKASAELGVLSPLKELGFSKARVRAMAAALHIPQRDKPSSPCLATRIPYGDPLTEGALSRIAEGEKYLHSLGFSVCRLRHHGDLARIEVPPADLPRVLSMREQIAEALASFSYRFVTLDLLGYRQGCYDSADD
ncbi:ATP-dependent sacrificial sulfur transferase LarE [Oscillospiraceae bacterium OttesenSCG-928-G22]|nr:ATP-dependent sacrificial sulfur transferase LarE [Oscillospiraceae bacterium OttesenSCG-928-G22]